tara:strand:+ start:1586 stop:1960 length:375 start_codon:yes stop_codon:yes gene_type:complete
MSESSGKQQRDIGMARVVTAARPSQKAAAKHAIAKVCRTTAPHNSWTTDEVHAVLEEMNVKLDNARLLGPLMKQAQKAGLIEPVVCDGCQRQETRLSRRKKRHAGPQYLWRTTPDYYYEYWKED